MITRRFCAIADAGRRAANSRIAMTEDFMTSSSFLIRFAKPLEPASTLSRTLFDMLGCVEVFRLFPEFDRVLRVSGFFLQQRCAAKSVGQIEGSSVWLVAVDAKRFVVTSSSTIEIAGVTIDIA